MLGLRLRVVAIGSRMNPVSRNHFEIRQWKSRPEAKYVSALTTHESTVSPTLWTPGSSVNI